MKRELPDELKFHLTNEEKPASHALDRAMGKRIWKTSRELTGLI